MLNRSIFREYDIRGTADTELLDADVELLGRAIGTYLIRHSGSTVCLGMDCRLSSGRLRDSLLKGLLATGCHVLDIGVVPTPILYYSAVHFRADGGVMITGSHNPPDFNGFKTLCGGSTLYGNAIQDLFKLIQNNDYDSGEGSVKAIDAITPYVDEIASQFTLKRKVTLVADAGNGVAGPALHRILEKLNVESIQMFFEMDGHFPNHHPDPTVVSNLEELKKRVRAEKADLGLAFDGDADRLGAVDEHGNVIYGDMLMLIFGREILSRKPGATLIGDVKCSQIMYDKLREWGGNPLMYKTGHSLIKAKMREEHAELAGEMSGHMFFSDRYYGYDDALYAACRLLEIVSNSEQPLSHQLEDVPQSVSTPELRIDCPDDKKFAIMGKVAEIYRRRRPIVEVDGVRVPFEQGWGLVRASNTQPALVMRFEAANKDLLEKYRTEVEEIVEEAKQKMPA
ncbi:MAG: phosphomannomutase/phosphoglucomutase [Acidobacteriaceae bacterium]|nr:phosphomannomutase/phosphoglucomutase [Acidobacteriaceae bacterium]MBV9780481.1 phosphomannomutase/phosphoglucomutase [Acidobacteriaceae bacterium]